MEVTMLLDINAYVGHWPFKQLQYNTCAKLLEKMNKFAVNVSVISNLNGIFYKNTQSANEELYEEIGSDKRFADRFIPFAIINPVYGGWREDFEVSITKLGMKGLRLFPQYHDYEITDPSLIELVKMARDRGVPVAFDIRMVDSRQKSWMDIPHFNPATDLKVDVITKEWTLKNIIPIIKEVPDARYLIVNLATSLNLSDEEVDLYKKANVLFDTSGRSIRGDNTLSELLNRFGTDKFAFGSHAPILDYLSGRLRVESLTEAEADEETKELLRSGNAKRFLGLS